MKKTFTVMILVLIAALLLVSCDNILKGPDAEKYIVSFDLDGGKGYIPEQSVVKDGKITAVKNPTKEGCAFCGWVNSSDNKTFDIATDTVSSDIILKAVWKISYTVTFETGEGASEVEDQVVGDGDNAVKPETAPTRKYYKFVRWAAAENGETDFDFNTKITKDTTLYAVWDLEYKVGDPGPAGGIIFYVAPSLETSRYTYTDSNGKAQEETLEWKYLEVAAEDNPKPASWLINWPSEEDFEGYKTETGVGTGWSNTKLLVAKGISNFPAAEYCVNYSTTKDDVAYKDWFLPSKCELNELYEAISKEDTMKDTIKLAKNNYYWSSSECKNYEKKVMCLDFEFGQLINCTNNFKDDDYLVRPIRAF